MKVVIFLGVIISFLVGCASNVNNQPVSTIKHCDIESFEALVVSGEAKVEIVNGSHAVDVAGPQVDNYDCPHGIANKALSINDSNRDYSIKVSVPDLKKLTVSEKAFVSSKKLLSRGLTIIAKDNAVVDLEGHFGVERIFQFSNGSMRISWIDSDKLFISGSGDGPFSLAGVVEDMVVKLVGNSFLDSRYLHAKNATVFTTDKSRAEIFAIEDLDAFAIDKSEIFYYQKPNHLTEVTRSSGNVLRAMWNQGDRP